MTFMCKFSMTDMKNVTWLMNGKNIEGYPHFKVTNKYKKKHNKIMFVSTMKIVSIFFIVSINIQLLFLNNHKKFVDKNDIFLFTNSFKLNIE